MQQRPAGPATGNTPPPSPDDPTHLKIDKEGINDDVVVGVLEQLEATGNRPHLIKELAVILTNSLKVVERYVIRKLPLLSQKLSC